MPPSHSFQHPAEDRLVRVAEQALGFRLGGDSTYCAAAAEHLSQPIMSTGRFRDTVGRFRDTVAISSQSRVSWR